MQYQHRGESPVVDESAFIAETAVLAGKVTVGAETSVMFGAVVTSQGSRVEIGSKVAVCENAVIRASAAGNEEHPVLIGDNVFVSPRATLIGCTVESSAYIAAGAVVLQKAVIKSGAVVGVGALVHAGTVVPEGFFVPPYAVAVGNPVKLYSPADQIEMTAAIREIGFANVAFGVKLAETSREDVNSAIAARRSAEFLEHKNDKKL